MALKYIKNGLALCQECGLLNFTLVKCRVDSSSNKSDEARIARLIGDIFNSRESDLKFTT